MFCHLCDTKCGCQAKSLGGYWNPVGFHSCELGYLIFYFSIDYSFLFHLFIFNWRIIALRCETVVFLHVFALCSCSCLDAVSHWLSVPHHQSEATADSLLIRHDFLVK